MQSIHPAVWAIIQLISGIAGFGLMMASASWLRQGKGKFLLWSLPLALLCALPTCLFRIGFAALPLMPPIREPYPGVDLGVRVVVYALVFASNYFVARPKKKLPERGNG